MNYNDDFRVRNSLTAAFLIILALGIGGYANTVRVQQAAASRDRRIGDLVDRASSCANSLALYSSQMNAYTGEYILTHDAAFRDLQSDAQQKSAAKLTLLGSTVDQLPNSEAVRERLRAIQNQAIRVNDPLETKAITLEAAGDQQHAKQTYNEGVAPACELLDNELLNLIGALEKYEDGSERLADVDRGHAVAVGWLVQGVILALSALIALAICLITGKNFQQLLDAQSRLTQSENRLRAALTGAPLILFATDTKGIFTLLEGRVLQDLGSSSQSMIGHALQDVFPDKAEAVANIERAIAGETFTATVNFDERTYSTSYSPQFDAAGKVTGIIGVATDITDRAAAEYEAERLVCELEEANQELAHAYDTTIQGWSAALDLRDRETDGHSRRVCELTVQMARAMGMPDEQIVHVRRGSLLHDIGKMGVPDGILLKPGPLSDDEWAIMRKHPEYAYELLSPIDFLRPALEIPLYHHEKWDGTGYPHQLKGEAIPVAARIFAIVDVWDALSSDRPYRSAWPTAKVLDHIRSLSGTHFDPEVVTVFQRVIGEHKTIRPSAGLTDLDIAA